MSAEKGNLSKEYLHQFLPHDAGRLQIGFAGMIMYLVSTCLPYLHIYIYNYYICIFNHHVYVSIIYNVSLCVVIEYCK